MKEFALWHWWQHLDQNRHIIPGLAGRLLVYILAMFYSHDKKHYMFLYCIFVFLIFFSSLQTSFRQSLIPYFLGNYLIVVLYKICYQMCNNIPNVFFINRLGKDFKRIKLLNKYRCFKLNYINLILGHAAGSLRSIGL